MNIFRFELTKHLRSILLWSLGILALTLFMMSFFPFMQSEYELMDLVLKYYPEELLKAFGLANVQSMATLEGYIPFIFIFIQLILAMHASTLGFRALTVEESERTADFLLTKPITRTRIYLSKISSGVVQLLMIALFSWLTLTVMIAVFANEEPIDQKAMTMLYASIPLFQLVYFSLGLVISMSLRHVRSIMGYAMGLSFATYGIYSIKGILDIDWLKYATPFHYFESSAILKDATIDPTFLVLSSILIILSMIGSYQGYLRRNIPLY